MLVQLGNICGVGLLANCVQSDDTNVGVPAIKALAL